MTKIRIPSDEFYRDVADLKRRYGRVSRPIPAPTAPPPAGVVWYWGKLTSAVTAGTLAAPTTFTFDIWLPDLASTADPVAFAVSPNAADLGLTGVNRMGLVAASGTIVQVEINHSEYTLKGLDC